MREIGKPQWLSAFLSVTSSPGALATRSNRLFAMMAMPPSLALWLLSSAVAYFNNWGGECNAPGAGSPSSYQGWALVTLTGANVEVLNRRVFDFAYVYAEIPREDAGWQSSLQGYHVQYSR